MNKARFRLCCRCREGSTMASVTLPWPRMSNIRQHRLCQEASPSVESAAHVLAGLTCFILLPLFHFQLFFFLLESMGGNGFVACLCWALVPSVTTRYVGCFVAHACVRQITVAGCAVCVSCSSFARRRYTEYWNEKATSCRVLRSCAYQPACSRSSSCYCRLGTQRGA